LVEKGGQHQAGHVLGGFKGGGGGRTTNVWQPWTIEKTTKKTKGDTNTKLIWNDKHQEKIVLLVSS